MTGSAVLFAVNLCYSLFALYFLVRILTVNPFLPKPIPNQTRIPPLHLLFLLALASLPLLVQLGFSDPSLRIPFALSWVAASLCALRHAYTAPLFEYDEPRPSLLHYPRLLLWRLDITSYILFLLARATLTSPSLLSAMLSSLVALGVLLTLAFDVLKRLTCQMLPITPRTILSSLTASGARGEQVTQVPPTMYDAPAIVLLSFSWTSQTVVTGRRRSLEPSDVVPMTEKYLSRVSANDAFLPQWKKELDRGPGSQPSVVRALFRAFGPRLLLSGFLKAINDACLFISPMLLRKVCIIIYHIITHPSPRFPFFRLSII